MAKVSRSIVIYQQSRWNNPSALFQVISDDLIPVHEDYKVNTNEQTFQLIPEDMKQVLDYAVSIDVQWIMFDSESLVEPNLPIYE